MRLIDADALIADCQLAQKQADRHGREFANAFYSGGGEVSTEWWCVEDMIENAPTIELRCENCEAFNKTRLLIPQKERTGRWIPCSERLPENIRPVIVTWKNTDPASYYQYIVGKHFTGTACYKNGKWYWYSSTTEDMLAEYGRYDSEEFDEAIECIAWMPLPEPYKEGE